MSYIELFEDEPEDGSERINIYNREMDGEIYVFMTIEFYTKLQNENSDGYWSPSSEDTISFPDIYAHKIAGSLLYDDPTERA